MNLNTVYRIFPSPLDANSEITLPQFKRPNFRF
jgi:hypothetical protein